MIVARCVTSDTRTANGEDYYSVDDGNPWLYSSTLWFFARQPSDATGWISEIWIDRADRGADGLPGAVWMQADGFTEA